MGVHGLTTYVEGNRNFLQDVKFRDSRLVIDGCSLFFRLYFNYGLDQQHGGDYDAFACLLSQFLSALEACNIQPYVVLDGGIDPSDKKFPTLRQRLQSKIKEADSLSHGRNGSVLPLLTRSVFIEVLIQRGVPLVQCPAEADWDIACLAHQWKCPVLTNDSDFYIFDLPGGYLPLHYFQWTNLNGKASHRYISARCYTTTGICRLYGGMNQQLLPLFAVLVGNDYGTPKDADALLGLLDAGVLVKGGGRGKGRAPASRIEGLLLWLSSFSSPGEALEEVSRLMGEKDRGPRGKSGEKGALSSQLWAGMQEYHIAPQSSLACWFSGGKTAPGRPSSDARVPVAGCSAGTVSSFGEYDRVDLNLKKNILEAHQLRTPLHLDTLGQAPVAVRLGVLLDVLGMKESVLAPVPLHLRLATAVIAFWHRVASPKPSQPQVQALVLGMIYGELSSNNQPGATHYQQANPQLNWAAERQVCAGLDRQRVRPGERRGLDVGAAHSFSQWQACLWSALCLNQLLLLPLPEPHISWLYSGTLVHGLLRYLKGGQAAESLLAGGSFSVHLYSSLLDAVRSRDSKTHPSSSAAGRGRRGGGRGRRERGRGRGRGGRGGRGGGRGSEEINNRFALLMSEDESDDD
ncbi:Protein asteroid like 1 [Dissostichus eleginoides]|uniref:Protein asteroid like 1 n=1 Tax=Dissostichus eleginoides TaxID=100907 RepID=A0AAD9BB32_DISEL|nr:Protein asteroid like 1 [Dissostichus eleginoides]